MHPYWFHSQRYFIDQVLGTELVNEEAKYGWWADEDFFERYKEWLWEEYQGTVGTQYTFKLDNPDVKSELEEWIDFKNPLQAELFLLKFSK